MFVKTDNQNNIITYPYNLDMYRAENRNVSLPKYLNNRFLATQNVYPVYEATKPEYDEINQNIRKDLENPYLDTDGVWRYGWIITDKSAEQIQQEFEIRTKKLKEQINQERDRRIALGFKWNENTFQSDKESYDNIMGAGASATAAVLMGTDPDNVYWADPDTPFTWLSMENKFVQMTPKDLIEFGQTAMNHKSKHIFAARTLKNMDVIPEDFADDKWWP